MYDAFAMLGTDLASKRKAEQRAERIAAFRAELAELEGERGLLLTPEQRAQLEAHLEGLLAALARQHGVEVSESARRVSWGMRLAALLGGAALGAAVVLFLHRVWGALPTAAQVLLLTAIPLLLLAGAEFAFRRRADPYYTALLALAAGIAFVTELNVLGGVFNVAPTPGALLAWAAFAVLLGYAYGLRLLLGAGLTLACAYTAALTCSASGGYWASFAQHTGFLLPAAAALYILPWLKVVRDTHGFHFVYRVCGAATALVALLSLSYGGHLCCIGLSRRALETLCQLAGLALGVGVTVHGLRLGRSGLVNLGAAGAVVFLFTRLHAWWWHWMPKYLFFLLLGGISFLLLLFFRRLRKGLSERSAA
jgi:uncharacterized membrane protein